MISLAACDSKRPVRTTTSPSTPEVVAPVEGQPTPVAEAVVEEDVSNKKEIDMYDLDYDEVNDRFLVPGTNTGYNGPVFSTHDNGELESRGMLKNGHEHGYWIEYFEDGVKSWEGAYIEGVEDGYWRMYWENGTLQSGGFYTNGSLTGRWISYFEDGDVDSEGAYNDGLMDGEWKFYDPDTGEGRTLRFDKGRELK